MNFRKLAYALLLAGPLGACAVAAERGPDGPAIPQTAVTPALTPAAEAQPGIGHDETAVADQAEVRLMGVAVSADLAGALSAEDKALLAQTTQVALESSGVGRTVTWSNPVNTAHGAVTPHERFQDDRGRLCRRFDLFLYVDWLFGEGRSEACRMVSGRWALPGDLDAPLRSHRTARR